MRKHILCGGSIDFDYEVEDGKVKMDTPNVRLVLAIQDTGDLDGPMGELKRVGK